ncbi:MAG: 50S ribosomal protein L22 [Candidatus Nanoarchaeia archaeon]
MADYKYAFQSYDAERMAKAVGRDIAVSTKQAIEMCNALRRKNLQYAKAFLEQVVQKKQYVLYTRFTNGIGHRKGGGAGAYPVKTATAVLGLLNTVEVNAQNKGLNTGQLSIIHICAQKASRPMHQGRKRRSEFKRSHVEVVVAEVEQKKKDKTVSVDKEDKKELSKAEKTEARNAVKKDIPKVEKKEALVEKREAKVENKEAEKTVEAPKVRKKEEQTGVKAETNADTSEVEKKEAEPVNKSQTKEEKQ